MARTINYRTYQGNATANDPTSELKFFIDDVQSGATQTGSGWYVDNYSGDIGTTNEDIFPRNAILDADIDYKVYTDLDAGTITIVEWATDIADRITSVYAIPAATADPARNISYRFVIEYTVTGATVMAEAVNLLPPNLNAAPNGYESIILSWTQNPDASGYEIRMAESESGLADASVQSIQWNVSGTAIESIPNDSWRYFQIRSVGDGVNYITSGWSDPASAKTNKIVRVLFGNQIALPERAILETSPVRLAEFNDHAENAALHFPSGASDGQVPVWDNDGIAWKYPVITETNGVYTLEFVDSLS